MRSKPLRTADYLRHIAEAIDNIVEFGVWNSVEFGVRFQLISR